MATQEKISLNHRASFAIEQNKAKPGEMDDGNSGFENQLKTISKQSGITLIGKIVYQVLNFISSVLLARILGASLLGSFQLGLVTVQILSTFSILGFDRGLVRFIPILNYENIGKLKKLLVHNLTLVILISSGFGLILYLNSSFIALKIFHSSEMIQVLKIFSFLLPVLALFTFGLAVLRGFKRADVMAYVESLIDPSVFIMLLLVILLFKVGLTEVILIRIFSKLVAIGCIIYFLSRKFLHVFKTHSISYDAKKYLAYSFPLMLISVLYIILNKTNMLMLGYFLEPSHVGVYTVILYIATFNTFGLQSVNTIFAPHIAELHDRGDLVNMEKLLKVLTKWIFYFSLIVFSIIIIFRMELLKIYGNIFTTGARALVFLALGEVINAATGSTGAILLMTGKQKWEVLNSFCILILNVAFNLYLIPKYGIEGAAIGFTLSISIINILKLLETYKEFKIHPYSIKYFKGFFAIAVGAFIAFWYYQLLNWFALNYIFNLLSGISILLLTSIVTLYFLKFDEEDKMILRMIVQKFKTNSNH